MERNKVLLIAYSCEPGRGSEWGTSWAFVNELARHQPVWIIVHADNRDGLDSYLKRTPTPHPIHVTYVAVPRAFGWMRKTAYAIQNVHYYLWQLAAARAARRLHAEVGFDVVQHVSWSRWWMPSAGATLARRGVRFIFGPCVGGETVPASFKRRAPWPVRWGEFQRAVARNIWSRDPMLARCVRAADMVVVGTPASVDGVNAFGPKRVEVMPAIMITDTRLIEAARPIRAARVVDDTLRLCSVGGMIHYRGVDLILRAIKASGIEKFHYTHCCGGPTFEAMKALAVELGIADRVTFTGETRHAENLQYVAKADALVHLVLRDSQGVVPEALALGVPVLALDHHSMAPIIDETVGHKVPMRPETTPAEVVAHVAAKLRHWADHRDELAAKGPACIARSGEFSPQHRVGLFRRWHAELVGSKASATMPASVKTAAA
jgi:glycosyltransferase involved in cell wall biosynthesis